MNSKKLISVVLSVLLLVSSAFCVSAELPAAKIEINLSTLNVEVKVTTEASEGRMVAMIRNQANTVWVGLDVAEEYVTDENGKNVYTFHMVMQPERETDVYTVSVGGNVALTEKNFNFANLSQLVAFYQKLALADANSIYALITGEENVVCYDFGAYKRLTPEIRALVDAEIAEFTEIDGVTIDNIDEKNEAFCAAMDDVMARAQIADINTESGTWLKLATMKNTDDATGVYDTKFLEKGNAKTVQKYCMAFRFNSLDKAVIQAALDKAQLLAVANEQGYSALQSAFQYYLEKGVLVLNAEAQTAYDEVCNAKKENAFFEQLKLLDNSTIEALEQNVPLAAEKAKEESVIGGGGFSGGGGSGTVGGGGYSGGGGSMGGNHKTPGTTLMDGDAQDTVVKKEESVVFSDLGDAAWAKGAIEVLATEGVLSGKGDGRFYPNDTVTREEFVKIIITAFSSIDEKAKASFEDVAEDRWSYPYIATANKMRLVTGVSETAFNPTGVMTREDMAVIAHRTMILCGIEEGNYTMDFADKDNISGYAVNAVNQLAGKNIINGMGDGSFAPKGTVTRAQAAKVVYELLVLNGGVN